MFNAMEQTAKNPFTHDTDVSIRLCYRNVLCKEANHAAPLHVDVVEVTKA